MSRLQRKDPESVALAGLRLFHHTEMGMSFITLILILMICVCCIVMTQSASNEDDWSHSRNPRANKGPMKRLMNLGKHENVGSSSSREIRKKGRQDEGSSSGKERLTRRTEMEIEPQPVIGTTSRSFRKPWTNEEQKALLRLAYITSTWKGPRTGGAFNWNTITEHHNRHWNARTRSTLRTKVPRMQGLMRLAGQNFDVEHGWAPWSNELGDYLIKIYFITEDGNRLEHGNRIFAEWSRKKLPIQEGMTPKNLLERAETMLASTMKFDISIPQDRTTMLGIREPVDWKPEQDEYFRQLLLKHPYSDENRMQNIFNEAWEKYPGLIFVGMRRTYEHLKQVYPELVDVPETSGLVGGSSHDTTHSKYHSSMDHYNSTSLSSQTHPHHDGTAGTSSHRVPSHDHSDLQLHLNTLHVDERNPDTELTLGYPPHRGGHN